MSTVQKSTVKDTHTLKRKRLENKLILGDTYRWAYDEAIRPLSLVEGQPLLLLQTEHDDGQTEDQRLPRASERNANHVSARKTTMKHKMYE